MVDFLVLTNIETNEYVHINITGADVNKVLESLSGITDENNKIIIGNVKIHLFGGGTKEK